MAGALTAANVPMYADPAAASPYGGVPYGGAFGSLPAGGQGALSAQDLQPSQQVQDLTNLSQSILPTGDIPGALSQAQTARQAASQQKIAAINNAMDVLRASRTGQINLPLLAAGAGMLQPARSFGESLGNAFGAAVPAVQNQRTADYQAAQQQGNLGIEAGQAGIDQATSDEDFLEKRLGLSREAAADAARQYAAQLATAARNNAANLNYQGKVDVANIASKSRLDVADVKALSNQVEYLGEKQGDPDTGLYLNKTTGQVQEGPASQQKGTAPSKSVTDAQWLVANHIAPDISTAYGMLRSGVNDGATFQRLVQAEKKLLLNTPQGYQMSPTDLENQARENVVARQKAGQANASAPATPAPAAPAPGAPAPKAATTAPAASPAVPKSLAGITGLRFNPARQQFMDPMNGNIYDQSGALVSGAQTPTR